MITKAEDFEAVNKRGDGTMKKNVVVHPSYTIITTMFFSLLFYYSG